MATQVFRVTRVLTAPASPVARLQAVDEGGHEARLEVPVALVQRIAPGHVLVLNWSVHALPEPLAPAPMDAAPVAAETPEFTMSGRAADAAFMDLMSRVRRDTSAAREPLTISTTPPASQTRSEPVINDEFDKLLGSTRTKG